MFAIYKKELKNYLNSVIGCLFISVTLFVQGAMFLLGNLAYGSPYLTYALSGTMLILVFTVPILTMKTLAEERKMKTDQMILTYPISVGKVIVGKYLALCTLYLVAILITCTYPLVLSGFGAIPYKQCYSAILGLFIYGCTLIAIGVFISSITESQVIAAIIGIVVLFMCFVSGDFAGMLEQKTSSFSNIIKAFDLYTPAEGFLNGYIELKSIVYYISIICLFIFLTTQSIQKKKWNINRQNISDVLYSVCFVIVAFVIVVFANLTVGKVTEDSTFSTIDMTDEKFYNLSDEMKKYLDDLNEDVTIFVLYNGEKMDDVIKKSLRNIASYSKHVKLVYKDTVKNPGFYSRFTDEAPNANSLIIVNDSTNKSKVVDYYDLLETNVDYSALSTEIEGYDCEGWVASGIDYVQSDSNSIIATVTGHGEAKLDSEFIEVIEKKNIDYKDINLLDTEIDNEKYQALLLLAPQTDYSKDEAEKIKKYIDDGGKVLMVTNGDLYVSGEENKKADNMENYESIANHYGVGIHHGIVIEGDSNYYYQTPMFILCKNGEDVGDGLKNYTLFGLAQGIYLMGDDENYNDEKYRYNKIFGTTDKAIINSDVSDENDYAKEEGDLEGEFALAVSVEQINENTKYEELVSDEREVHKGSNLTIVGSSSVFTEYTNEVVAGGNLQFFESIIKRFNLSADKDVDIAPKYLIYKNLTISNGAMTVVGLIVAIVVPIVVLVAGIVVWARRRRL